MEFIDWDELIMDGLRISAVLKEIFEKLEDLIQMLTRKRNSFNEKFDDFLILTILSTINKRGILKIKDYELTKKILPDNLVPKTYQLPNQGEVHKLKYDLLQWQNEEEFYSYCPPC